jgi:hypothetical protein
MATLITQYLPTPMCINFVQFELQLTWYSNSWFWKKVCVLYIDTNKIQYWGFTKSEIKISHFQKPKINYFLNTSLIMCHAYMKFIVQRMLAITDKIHITSNISSIINLPLFLRSLTFKASPTFLLALYTFYVSENKAVTKISGQMN